MALALPGSFGARDCGHLRPALHAGVPQLPGRRRRPRRRPAGRVWDWGAGVLFALAGGQEEDEGSGDEVRLGMRTGDGPGWGLIRSAICG